MLLVYILATSPTILAYEVVGVIRGAFRGAFGGSAGVSGGGGCTGGLVYA
jgi:hypothetical protein